MDDHPYREQKVVVETCKRCQQFMEASSDKKIRYWRNIKVTIPFALFTLIVISFLVVSAAWVAGDKNIFKTFVMSFNIVLGSEFVIWGIASIIYWFDN